MNQTKFSLSDVLTTLIALGFGFVCFVGTNFYTLGNVPESIAVALLITLLLFSTVYTAKLLKRTSTNFKIRFIWEILFLVIFTMLFVFFTYMPFSHYFTVSANKSEIVNKIQTSIAQAENIFPAYETYANDRKGLYRRNLIDAIENKDDLNSLDYNNFGFENGTPDEIQLNKKIENIETNLFPSNYSDPETQKGIKEVATNWLLKAKKSTESWKPIGITNAVVDIESISNEWLSTLIEFSKIQEKGEQAEDFYTPLTFDDIKQHFTTVGKPTVSSLLLALLMWILMMLSWFVAKRSTKTTICTTKNKGEFDIEI